MKHSSRIARIIINVSIFLLLLVIQVAPIAFASNTGGGGNGGGGSTGLDFKLENPLQYGTLCQLINAILNIIMEIGAIVAVIIFIFVGFKFIRAQGNPSEIGKAKDAFFTTVIGTAVLLGASAIAKIVFTTIMNISKANGSTAGAC